MDEISSRLDPHEPIMRNNSQGSQYLSFQNPYMLEQSIIVKRYGWSISPQRMSSNVKLRVLNRDYKSNHFSKQHFNMLVGKRKCNRDILILVLNEIIFLSALGSTIAMVLINNNLFGLAIFLSIILLTILVNLQQHYKKKSLWNNKQNNYQSIQKFRQESPKFTQQYMDQQQTRNLKMTYKKVEQIRGSDVFLHEEKQQRLFNSVILQENKVPPFWLNAINQITKPYISISHENRIVIQDNSLQDRIKEEMKEFVVEKTLQKEGVIRKDRHKQHSISVSIANFLQIPTCFISKQPQGSVSNFFYYLTRVLCVHSLYHWWKFSKTEEIIIIHEFNLKSSEILEI